VLYPFSMGQFQRKSYFPLETGLQLTNDDESAIHH